MEDAGTDFDLTSVERVIAASPSAIFDLLADPSRHHEIDGSGSVRDAKAGSQRLALGSKFVMSMKMGIPYSTVSEVVEFEVDRSIAWQTYSTIKWLSKFGGGRIWRYELEPVDGGTLVKESRDIRQESTATRSLVRRDAEKTRKNMAATLERIEGLVS